ncbi:MAG: dienelactone hydrolase family protein [Burkholderiales bacterium]|jgi:phospholipase/carboxylesterase|nr:dienelactone hydrolase family protein [Burkholderiales bacterium]
MTVPTLLSYIEIETQPNPDATVIWLHGLGDDGYGWSSAVSALGLPTAARIRFLFPHAPMMAVTINQGYRMRAWYDVVGSDLSTRADLDGMRASQENIEALLRHEAGRGIAPSRTVLAGFSQGGAVALYAGLRHPERLAGIVALSTYLMGTETLEQEASAANRQTPIFMAHGTDDPVVLPQWGEVSRDALRARHYEVDWRTYPMPHSATEQELRDVGAFLARVLPVFATETAEQKQG